MALILGFRKEKNKKNQAQAFLPTSSPSWVEKFQNSLPFPLTSGQKEVFKEISQDLAQKTPMNRLLQGDVGSGKTLVAFLSSLVVMEQGGQVALMAPTEILAQQHYRNALKLFKNLGVRVELLIGQLKAREKRERTSLVACGQVDLVIGTHALIQSGVRFSHLSLVIVDEQHRFGVEQRKKLQQKGKSPHFLLMTATPIPRSLALTLHGDLDVSYLNELPKGRQTLVTRVTKTHQRPKILQFIREQVEKGRQAYIVYPLVEEREKQDLGSATQEYKKLQKDFEGLRLGLLHGQMTGKVKNSTMEKFRQGHLDLLVATTVIEVGVDVPNANLIWIGNSERFGLSQLHQLRGRVGRGHHKSYCILSMGERASPEAENRLRWMEKTQDGFEIAEVDLKLRGPGEFLGHRQSGLPGFKIAHIVKHGEIFKKARKAASEILEKDPQLSKTESQRLREELEKRQQTLE